VVNEPKWVAKWAADRAAGRGRYIFRLGLSYGAAMFIATTFVVAHPPLTASLLLARALIWAMGGALFGSLMWWISEWRYQRHLRTAGRPRDPRAP